MLLLCELELATFHTKVLHISAARPGDDHSIRAKAKCQSPHDRSQVVLCVKNGVCDGIYTVRPWPVILVLPVLARAAIAGAGTARADSGLHGQGQPPRDAMQPVAGYAAAAVDIETEEKRPAQPC